MHAADQDSVWQKTAGNQWQSESYGSLHIQIEVINKHSLCAAIFDIKAQIYSLPLCLSETNVRVLQLN